MPRHRGPGLGDLRAAAPARSSWSGTRWAVASRRRSPRATPTSSVRRSWRTRPGSSQVSWEDRHESAVERVATCRAVPRRPRDGRGPGPGRERRLARGGARPVGAAPRPRSTSASSRPAWPSSTRRGRRSPPAITVPTLVVAGTARVILGADTRAGRSRTWANPHLEVAVVADAGHCVRRDVPEAYHALVDPGWPSTADRPRLVRQRGPARGAATHRVRPPVVRAGRAGPSSSVASYQSRSSSSSSSDSSTWNDTTRWSGTGCDR